MSDENVISPDEEVTPEEDALTEDGQSEETADEEAGIEASDEEADDNASEEGEASDETEGEDEEPEVVEINVGGEKLTVPKGSVPDDLLAKVQEFTTGVERSFTQKFQETAEMRKQAEASKELADKLASMEGEALQSFSRGMALKQEIERLSQVNMQELWQSNPDQARRLSDDLARMNADFQKIAQETSQREAEAAKARQEATAMLMEEGRKRVTTKIKDFSEREPEIIKYVVENYGMTEDEAKTWPLNPTTAEMAYKAYLYDQMKANASKKPAPQKKAPAKPVGTLKPKGGAAPKDISNMSPSEMAKHLGLPG